MKSAKLKLERLSAVVTGGASGIGRAVAERLSQRQVRVTILDRNSVEGAKVAEEIGCHFMELDVSDRAACWNAVQAIESKAQIDLLVCSAGVVRPCSIFGFPSDNPLGAGHSPLESYESVIEEYQREHAVNVAGYLHMLTAVAAHMRPRNAGGICLIGSSAGDVGLYERFPYCLTKGATHQMVRAAAADFSRAGASGLRIFGVAPARVITPLMINNLEKIEAGRGAAAREREFLAYGSSQFEGRVLLPEEVAELVVFQLEANTTSGEVLAIGGWKGQPF